MIYGLLPLLILAVTVLTVIDIAKANDYDVRGLPKIVWLLLALFAPIVGAAAWFIAGRPDSVHWSQAQGRQPATAFPEYERPGRQIPENSAADEEFLRQCRERAEEQRRRYREEERKRTEDG